MKEQFSQIEDVQQLTDEEIQSIEGGCISLIPSWLKLGLGIGSGWLIAEGVRSC